MPRARTSTLVARGAVVAAVLAGVALRCYSRSDLWLDEALSANIAALPLSDLLDQLRVEAHPPAYYLLLHAWMAIFGEGDLAARSLSGAFAIATVPLFWFAAKRYGGHAAAVAGVVLLATSPFAIRYGTEVRMYSMAMFLVVAGWLAVRRAWDRPTAGRLALVALCSGALLLTHYWSFFLLAAVGLLVAVRWWRTRDPAPLRVLAGLAGGGVLFLPWLPSFLEQLRGSGTPWGGPNRPTAVVAVTLTEWGGGNFAEAQLLAIGLVVVVLLALFGAAAGDLVELDLRTRPRSRPEALVVAGTLAIATVVAYATDAAFAGRYTAVVLPLFLLLAALGAATLADARHRAVVLVVLAVLGLAGGGRNLTTSRTQGGDIGTHIAEQGAPGDVVAFCPDQLGPSTMRHVPADRTGMAFPEGGDPRFVDWVDYEERMATGDPAAFAAEVDARAGRTGAVWFVWSGGYRTLGDSCERTFQALAGLRPGGAVVQGSGEEFEHATLHRFDPPG